MKLAKAAAQQLKGVIVEYDVLCSTLIGRSVAEQVAQQQQRKRTAAEQQAQSQNSVGQRVAAVRSMLSDVRAMLRDAGQDTKGKPWVARNRLQNVLQGLPTQYLNKVMGDTDAERAAKSDDERFLESQLASAAQEREREREQKDAMRRELQERMGVGGALGDSTNGDSSSARDKYLDKIKQLKAKAKNRVEDASASAPPLGLDVLEESLSLTSKGLSTWLVNDGANELLSYSTTRGLFKAVLPNQSPVQNDEFQFFLKEMDGQFDAIMSRDAYAKLPDPDPIVSLCGDLGLKPSEVLVVVRSTAGVRAAKAAGAHTCHFQLSASDIPNHNAHYRLTTLKDFQFLVEEFNGISYRGKTPEIVW
ncbi:hypothetical protein PybrP1_008864 [[Pythium] brassicae (nom. inval.)]|nr:hypothetical protein PybrP1_008864 [[Pythium] brassicae (nom. inval.)]